jgi:hypothetical protein
MSPDITMCKGDDCPKRDKCYRYLAEPEPHMQSYFLTPPNIDGVECDSFWEIDGNDV